ncbi:MAG TPA: chorismate-binding protein, partial [Acidimicrobiales bacterium]|nr:chorismate-binding protein [Acidimicrobiales bacterium]
MAAPPGTPVDAVDPPDPTDFVATSRSVDPSIWSMRSVETIAASADAGVLVAGRERLLAGRGVAATLPLPCGLQDEAALVALRAWLAAVEIATPDVDRPSTSPPGVMALGAFPFDRAAPAALVVPSVTWCHDSGGHTWRVEVRRRGATAEGSGTDAVRRADDDRTDAAPAPGADAATVGAPRIDQVPAPGHYADAVARAVADIRSGRLRKVVLARMVEVLLTAPAVPSRVLGALWGGDPVFSPFSVPTQTGRLVGASPELVISRRDRTVTSHALAGTTPLSEPDAKGDAATADAARLFDSVKDRNEHRMVVEEIVDALERRCVALTVPVEPTVVRLRSDARLGTLIRGTLTNVPSDGDAALSLLALLHPTPAVAGVPRAAAHERIA